MVIAKRGRPGCSCGSKRAGAVPVELLQHTYIDGEWALQFEMWRFLIDGEEIEVTRNTVQTGDWEVIAEGALDFQGNKKELLAEYPEIRKYLQ